MMIESFEKSMIDDGTNFKELIESRLINNMCIKIWMKDLMIDDVVRVKTEFRNF